VRKVGSVSLKQRWFRDKLRRRAGQGFQGYPVATVAFYGPDDQRASKLVVSIIMEGTKTVDLERWFSDAGDVRSDPVITEAVWRFIRTHKVRSVVAADRIIGCPHEEGIDYPAGEKCPCCPFWANRDRWTGEIMQ